MLDYWVLGLIAAYFILLRWVLPCFGVPTGMANSCSVESRRKEEKEPANRLHKPSFLRQASSRTTASSNGASTLET